MFSRMRLFITLTLVSTTAFAQTYNLTGSIKDASDQSGLISAAVFLSPVRDTINKKAVTTDLDGNFTFTELKSGVYRLSVSYIGYTPLTQIVKIEGADKALGVMKMAQNATTLKDVNVTETATRVVQKADTSEYNAKSFKTHPDASAEDLVTKMPGITSDNGTVKAHGEQVQKVLVDGKEYFGDDATLALKNLPSEIIDKVQVFDRMSDQSRFTGFDDGNSVKAMNIITKKGRNNGVFGKLYAGYGYIEDSRYSAGGALNWFNGDRRISLIGMSNNVNLQNFASQDLLGVTGASAARGGGGGGQRAGGGGGAANNFLVGQQGGISTTNSLGFNYADVLGKKKNLKITGSYFFNQTDNNNNTSLSRQFYHTGDTATSYSEQNNSTSRNRNHRINLRLEYTIDSMNSLIFTPKFSYQENILHNLIDGRTFTPESTLSTTKSDYTSTNSGYNAGGDLLYQHKFTTVGRTIAVNIGTTINNKQGTTTQDAVNQYFTQNDSTILNQKATTLSRSYNVNGNITYTEPVTKISQLQFNYTPSYTWNKADKETFDRDSAGAYSSLNKPLSNKYDNTYMTQKVGMTYRLNGGQYNFSAGVNIQYALLTGQEVFPVSFQTHRSFNDILPNAMFNYTFKDKSALRIFYRTSTNVPSIAQLQTVVDNSNPLLLNTGNQNLDQSYSHFLLLRYGLAKSSKGHSFFLFATVSATQKYIGNSTFIATKDTLIQNTIALQRGSQLTLPVNINGNWNSNIFLNYGLPINAIKCNLNLTAGFAFTRTPGLVNNNPNFANTYVPTAGLVLGSNISEKVDFTISYTGSYNVVKNTLQTNADNNYFSHSANLKFNWLFWKGFVYNTTLQNTLYTGIANGYNQDIFLWNMSLGYKFLKDKSLEVKMGVNDILNQNSGISRSITETYVQDSRTQVLKRYWMLTVTFNLRYFKGVKGNNVQEEKQNNNNMLPPMPPGGPRGGGFPGGGPPGGF